MVFRIQDHLIQILLVVVLACLVDDSDRADHQQTDRRHDIAKEDPLLHIQILFLIVARIIMSLGDLA